MTVEPANADDAHRPLEKSHNLAASLSYVETRQVRNDYTLPWQGKLYQIERQAVTTGLCRANVRVEQRLDASLAVRPRRTVSADQRVCRGGEAESRSSTEKLSARPAGKPEYFFVKGASATIPSLPLASCSH